VNTSSSSFQSEDEWTARLERLLSKRSDIKVGVGDDAAVVKSPGLDFDVVYTTDAVVESVHFLPGTEPRRIGHKMVGRLLSDLAAMGAEPDHILLNLVVPAGCPAISLEQIYEGAEQLAKAFGASIVGGDTMKSTPLALHGFASGRLPAGSALLRSGAKPGDRLYVTGRLGGSMIGKHLDFTPRVAEGIWLRKSGWVTAMMDISDGLSMDLPRMCAKSGVGACVNADDVPVTKDTDLNHALCDGEDYELLFTVKPEQAAAFEQAWIGFSKLPCTCIGEMQGGPDKLELILPNGSLQPFTSAGYDHLEH